MKKKMNSGPMIESLESRRLFSAVATISADVTQLKTDVTTLKAAVKTLKVDLVSSITAGTTGLDNLVKELKHIHNYDKTAKTILAADIAAVVADKGKDSEAAAQATLTTDLAAIKAKLKTDLADAGAIVTRHPTLISADENLTADEAAVQTDYGLVKNDIATLEAAI